MFRRTLLIAVLLLSLPLIVAAAEDAPAPALAEAPAVEVDVEVREATTSTLAPTADATPPALFVADFQGAQTKWGCSRPSCNQNFQCGWMKSQCSLHSYPVCDGGTGSGCQGECVCACS